MKKSNVRRTASFLILSITIGGIAVGTFPGCASSRITEERYSEPAIISVDEWGGKSADSGRVHSINSITLHHGGETFPRDKDPVLYLRTLQQWSRSEKKWIDIPYHFIIDLDGRVYEGRPLRFAGDTNTDYDPAGHALVCVVGNYEEREPSESQLRSVVRMFVWLSKKYHIPREKILGHKDVAKNTVCPGKNLYRYLENGYFQQEVAKALK